MFSVQKILLSTLSINVNSIMRFIFLDELQPGNQLLGHVTNLIVFYFGFQYLCLKKNMCFESLHTIFLTTN